MTLSDALMYLREPGYELRCQHPDVEGVRWRVEGKRIQSVTEITRAFAGRQVKRERAEWGLPENLEILNSNWHVERIRSSPALGDVFPEAKS
jgi:hypothetical protein